MSLQTSRFESQQIVNNFNVFVDTEKTNLLGHGNNTGDACDIHFEGNSIEAGDGEIIRVSLTNFTMFNNIYDVNVNNAKFRVRASGTGSTRYQELFIKHQNYKNLSDLANAFADALQTELVAAASANSGNTDITTTPRVVKPTTTGLTATGDRLFSVVYTFAGAHAISSLKIQMKENDGDSYALMGGERLDNDDANTNTTHDSMNVVITTNTITVKGFFPMQRLTDPYVYVRCSATNNGLEMATLQGGSSTTQKPDIVNSDILGKVFKDVEFINFHSSTDEYFINLQQRRLSTLRLFLTDKNGRRLGRLLDSNSGTASGRTSLSDNTGAHLSSKQSTLGNLFFTAVLKVEIIKVRNPKKLDSEDPPKPLPARFAQAPYQVQDFGMPRH
jgi:hypothetical protein